MAQPSRSSAWSRRRWSGGALVRALPAAWSMFGRSLAPFQGVFLIGAVARLFAALLGLRIEEPRPEGA
jgi:hypothetical protein